MEERKLVDIEEVKDVLGDTINSEGDYRHALRLLNGLSSVTEQDIVKPILDEIRAEISKAWYTHPQSRYEEGLKDQALRDMKILDRYKVESEDE